MVLLSRLGKDRSKILKYIAAQCALLIIKAVLTLNVATLDGKLVSSMVSKRFRRFSKYFVMWFLLGIPSALVKSLIQRTQGLLSEAVRSSLTDSLLDEYLPHSGNTTVYQLVNSQALKDDPNHLITSVVQQFARCFSILPFQLFDPILDITLAASRMSRVSDYASEGTLMLGLVANFSTLLLKVFTPNFAMLTATRAALESKFHGLHSGIVDHREEIALSRGHRHELDMLDTTYFEAERFQRHELRRLAVYHFAVGFIFKYGLGAFGLMLCAAPVFTTAYMSNYRINSKQVAQLSSDFFANRRLLLSASDSLGRLIQSKKNIQTMHGYSQSLCEFYDALQDINKLSKACDDDKLIVGPNISYEDRIAFEHVPLVTPSGTVLAQDITFSITPGQNLLIIGPNGCGKSSLFRILGGLWEVNEPGHVVVPASRRDVFYLPQRSYLTYGTLREQITYPDSECLKDDSHLVELLRLVHLEHLITTDLDVIEKWPDILSVGEQQRLAMARLYYHQPKFAVLDECTSSISPDLEKECYQIATQRFGITVLSVCHHTSLWEFHSYVLKFKKDQNPIFTKFDPKLRLERHRELIEVETALKRDEDLATRLDSLKAQRHGGLYIA